MHGIFFLDPRSKMLFDRQGRCGPIDQPAATPDVKQVLASTLETSRTAEKASDREVIAWDTDAPGGPRQARPGQEARST
jgi:hypothetical protein